MMIVTTNTVMTTGEIPMTAIGVNTEDVLITTSILDTENVHTIDTVITSIAILKGAGISIMVIGGPGINGIGIEDSTLKYKNMEDIIARADI
jgi:hypothetical protein